ncbi:MAG: carboxylesterase/lipase family protein [Deltaproteobacteria bacterium]|nr:carboxylesterase/lipase family protein [Deltaproteobacteria bacterium]
MGVVVATTHGKIEGVQAEGHQFFRGIPYAAPPVGDARFAAPRPPEPWAGIRDCLSLNVYTPAAAGATPAAAGATPAAAGATPATAAASRPVMVWIHGGGFTGGSGSQALYEGASLTCRGQIVLVTVNYRLGILGYLHLADHADRLEGATSNVGQRDQIAALEWVRDNIEAFGGDPNRVTIFGESAGGMAVSTLLAMPGARGLFHGAIAQSGATHATHSRDSATRVVDAVLGELEISSEKIERLREISTDEILRAQLRVSAQLAGDVFLSYAPTIDADTLPQAPLDLIRAGESQARSTSNSMMHRSRRRWHRVSGISKGPIHSASSRSIAHADHRPPPGTSSTRSRPTACSEFQPSGWPRPGVLTRRRPTSIRSTGSLRRGAESSARATHSSFPSSSTPSMRRRWIALRARARRRMHCARP